MQYRAIILADRSGVELTPLDEIACPALLEVAGKTVIEYTLEDLVEAGFREAVVVTSSLEVMRRKLGDGERWGIRLKYLLVKADSEPRDILARVTDTMPMLVVRGDRLRGRFIRRFIDSPAQREVIAKAAVSLGRPAGAWCGPRDVLRTLADGEDGCYGSPVEVGDIGLHELDSLEDFHAACLAAARGALPGIRFGGREISAGIHAGRLAKVGDADVREGALYAAEQARIGRGAAIRGTVVVGRGALIDRGARLEDSVVMPDSYVGSGVELKHAIVAGGKLIRVDLGSTTEVTDDFLLTSLDKPAWSPAMVSPIDRFVGLLLLLASAPFWPVAMVASLLESPRQPIARRRLISNLSRTEQPVDFTVWSWATRVPILAHLPRVMAVVAGHLRLVGIRAAMPGLQSSFRDGSPAGLFGPALLDVGPCASEEECRLAEAVFERRNTRLRQFAYLGRAARLLFSRRAWRGDVDAHREVDVSVSLESALGTDG